MCATKHQLPLRKNYRPTGEQTPVGAVQCSTVSVWAVAFFLASTGNEKRVQRFLIWKDTKHMGYGKPPLANVYLYFVSSDSSKHWNRNLLPEVLFLNRWFAKTTITFLNIFFPPHKQLNIPAQTLTVS
jgi:hypothetical protein